MSVALILSVASFTDAWIETVQEGKERQILWSHLLQMRGLKHQFRQETTRENNVASFTDAWIETKIEKLDEQQNMSHLLQMRGLKLFP